VSAIHLDNRLLHYEVFGRGQPIIFLHSWVGSWRYWVDTMEHSAERYRAYALDFWGFGESERERGQFSISEYVDLVLGFMDNMGMARANLVGHGLGGMVAVRAAREQPQRFIKAMIVSTPLQGSLLAHVHKQGTFSRLLGRGQPTNVWSKVIKGMSFDDDAIHHELQEDTDSLSEQVVSRVHESVSETDLRPDLAHVEQPLLAVYGSKDTLVSPDHARFLADDAGRPHQLIELPRSGHFPFLDQPTTFQRLLLDFLASQGTSVEIKEQWRRKVSQREYL
jgi:pimeloyl-ACP methyl ester carboxylesterase